MTASSVEERAVIMALGRVLSPDVLAAVQNLYGSEQSRLAEAEPVIAADQAYGPHPRQVLDLYARAGVTDAPTLLFVHGGGFMRGDKGDAGQPFNAHVGRWAARHGMIGAVMNYRLAPEATWPAGGEDVADAVDRLRTAVGAHGGDPDRIVLMGTSAGAVHVASALQLRPDLPVAGAILLSGLYGFTPLDERDTLYYGDPALYAQRMPRDAVVETAVPLFIACAEFDPPRFQTETFGLLTARLARHGALEHAYIAGGHNHFSLAYHLGTGDTRLGDEILAFIQAHIGASS